MFPLSQLPADIADRHRAYAGSPFLTWVKVAPALDLVRFTISLSTGRDINKMRAEAWQMIQEDN